MLTPLTGFLDLQKEMAVCSGGNDLRFQVCSLPLPFRGLDGDHLTQVVFLSISSLIQNGVEDKPRKPARVAQRYAQRQVVLYPVNSG